LKYPVGKKRGGEDIAMTHTIPVLWSANFSLLGLPCYQHLLTRLRKTEGTFGKLG